MQSIFISFAKTDKLDGNAGKKCKQESMEVQIIRKTLALDYFLGYGHLNYSLSVLQFRLSLNYASKLYHWNKVKAVMAKSMLYIYFHKILTFCS